MHNSSKKIIAEKRKLYNKTYYERLKEKKKMRQTANGEVSSQNMTPMTNVSTTQRTLADITNVTPTSVLDFAQRKSIKNRNAYQRRKERNSPTTPIEISH